VYGPSELIVHGNAAAAKQRRGLLRDESKTYSKPVAIFFSFWNVFSWAQILAGESICRSVYQAMVPVKDGRAS